MDGGENAQSADSPPDDSIVQDAGKRKASAEYTDSTEFLPRVKRLSSLAISRKTNTVNVNRPVFTQKNFDTGFQVRARKGINIKDRLLKKFNSGCSIQRLKAMLLRYIPSIEIMMKYNPRADLPGDISAGLTVGVLNIPQGMAYSVLASLPPIYGLYTSFFPLIIYFIFGCSRHISIGTFAIMSLMIASAVDSQAEFCNSYSKNQEAGTALNSTFESGSTANSSAYNGSEAFDYASSVSECKVGVATTLAFFVGVFQFVMGLLHFGFVTIYLADPLISGFTTGAACHILTSQIKDMLGIKVKRYTGPLNLFYTYIDIFKNITSINWAELIIAGICLIVLILVKECINERFKKKLKVPVPIDLVVVIAGTLISYLANLNAVYKINVLGDIPASFPKPSVPPMWQVTSLLPNAFTQAVIAFAVSVSTAKTFAKKHNYEIDSDQEFLAYGLSNMFSSFFMCFPSCASLSRGVMQESQGAKTQISSLISGALVLIVLLVLGPYFKTLPKSVLAAVIVVSLKGLFKQFSELRNLWSFSYYDFFINHVVLFVGLLPAEYFLLSSALTQSLSSRDRYMSP